MRSTPCSSVVSRDDPEVRAIIEAIMESKARKAGLTGAYRHAESDLGRRVWSMAEGGRGAYLWGEPGTGKTWAASCAVRMAMESQDPLRPVAARIVSSKRLLDDVKAGYDGGIRGALEGARTIRLLALDDLGVERPTDWAIETLAELIDARTMAGLPIIVTSNYRIGQLASLWGGMPGKRTASRLAGACEAIEVTGRDRRWE